MIMSSRMSGGGGNFSPKGGGRIPSENALLKGLNIPPSKWYQLGVELNISDSTLKAIEYNYMHAGGVSRCLSETLVCWYKNNTGASWNDICAALHAVHEQVLAKEVAKKHGCAPVIVSHPESSYVELGEKAVTFRCVATGTLPLFYSWKFKGGVLTGKTESTLTIPKVNRKLAGTYRCCVKNRFDDVTSKPAELRIGKEVTEDSMYDLLKKCGLQDADWLVIAKHLGLTAQTLAGVFLAAWKESDSAGPSWQKLSKALAQISEGGGLYTLASQQAERNAGYELTVATMCSTFSEVGLDEPNWQAVSQELGLDLYGQVSAEELYQAWCKHGPSWEKLSRALGKFQAYQRVAEKAIKKAGVVLKSDSICRALTEAGIESPDWGRIGKEFGLELKGRITASLFTEEWRKHGPEMSWERLAQCLEEIEGYESAAKKAKLKTGQVFNQSTMCRALKEAGIQTPDWDRIGKELNVNVQPISASTFFESWYAYAHNCQPTWNQLAQALESTGNSKDKKAAVDVWAREGQEMTKDKVRAVLQKAGIQTPDWEKIAKLLCLDTAILSSAFFTQWCALAHDRKPSWKALATGLENVGDQKHKQAAMNIQQMGGEQQLTEENIKQILFQANIQKPDWGKIARGLGFQLQRQNPFLEGWYTFAHSSKPSWENLAFALEKTREYKSLVEMMQSKSGQQFNQDTMCTAFREAGVQLPDWAKIAKQLSISMQLQISADEFFKGWFAYTDHYQPSWVILAQALERTGIPNYKQAAGKVWKTQGLLGQETACSILSDCGIQEPDWGKIGKCLGLDSLIKPTSFFKRWQVRACNCSPSWERLACALETTSSWQYKEIVPIAREKEGKEQLNVETLNKVVCEATTQPPDWGKFANFLGFKQYVRGQATVNSFLEGWNAYARNFQPSWKLLGRALDNIKDYKQMVKRILENAGEKLNADTLCKLLTEAGVLSPDWERIGKQLGLHIKGQISAADFFDAWCCQDFQSSWIKLADALEKVEEYKHAAQSVRGKQVQELNKESMVAIFSEAGVSAPENWREIGVHLSLKLRGQLSAAMFFKGWSERRSSHKPTWEKLASALSKISGYRLAAAKAREKAPLQLSESKMSELFQDTDEVDWLLISQRLRLTQVWINRHCLRQTLKRWDNNRVDPWSTWRKLAVAVENVYDSQAGQKLRRLAGVALELNAENMSNVLKTAGITDSDWQYIADRLGLTQSFAGWLMQTGKNLLGFDCWKEVLSKWRDQGSHVSWDKLAEAVQEKYGVDASQTILELSGEGGCPAIVKHPADTKVAIRGKVYFECQAVGAPPLRYTWLHNGTDMPAKNEKKLEFVVLKGSGGEYSCRVENEFGSKTCAPAKLTVGESPEIKSIHTDNKNIETGGTVNICCTATGDPPLRYTWLFTSTAATSSTVLPNEDEPTLVIRAAKETDHQGSYQCRVTNDFGDVTSDPNSLQIKVGNPPTVEKFGIDGTSKISFRIEEKVNFYCEAKGTPPLHYIWHYNNEVISRRCNDNKLSVTATEKTEGEYSCTVENLFGSKSSEVVRIEVGSRPQIDVHPEIRGTVEPGDFLQLKCKASGKGSLNYVWQHGNQTLVIETRPELIIKHVKESNQGTYSCRVTSAFGYATSNPVLLKLTITQGELMKELGPHVAPRWYMLAVLLDIPKPVIDRISKGFAANENTNYSLSEVVETWLEEINATTDDQLALESSPDPSSPNSNEAFKMEPSRYWLKIYHVVKRMGYMTFARDLNTKYKLLVESADVHPEYDQTKEKEEQPSKMESKVTPVDDNEMHQRFTALIDKVQPHLATPDTGPTETCSTSASATDTSVSECQAYLHLIDFPPEETECIADLPSLFNLLTPYLNFQRFHIFEMIIGQFKSATAREKTQKYREKYLNVYQANVKLGRFALANEKRSPAVNPPFMRPFRLQLESKWATCTVQDLERLLICLLPKSIGYTFVWFCKAYQVADDNSICLEYIVSPSVVDILTEEAEKKRGILRSAGILSLHIDGTPIRPKEVIGDEKVETFLKKLLPQGRLPQREPPPVSKADTVQSLDGKPSDCPTEEAEEIPPEKSDIEKLQESLEEKEAALKQSLEQAEIEHRSELEKVKKELQEVQGKLKDKGNDIRRLQTAVNQHKFELEKTPLSTLDQSCRDLKLKLVDEGSKRADNQLNTMRKLERVQTTLKSEVKTDIEAQIPGLQLHMKEILDAAVRQLRDEMERKLSDMRSEVLRQQLEQEERHLRQNGSTAEDQRRQIERCRDEISQLRQRLEDHRVGQLKQEILREVQENGGRDKP